jgi:hypothetical protein
MTKEAHTMTHPLLKLPTVPEVYRDYLNPKTRKSGWWEYVSRDGEPDEHALAMSILEDVMHNDAWDALPMERQIEIEADADEIAADALALLDDAADVAAEGFVDALSDADRAVEDARPNARRLPSDVFEDRAYRYECDNAECLARVFFQRGKLRELYADLADLTERL